MPDLTRQQIKDIFRRTEDALHSLDEASHQLATISHELHVDKVPPRLQVDLDEVATSVGFARKRFMDEIAPAITSFGTKLMSS